MLLRKDVIRPGVYMPADGEPRRVTQEEINRWVENHKKLTEAGYRVPLYMTHPGQHERHSWPMREKQLESVKDDPWFLGTVKGYAVDKDGVLQVEYEDEDEKRAKRLTTKNAAVSPQFGPWIDPDDPSSKWDGIIGHIAVTKRPVNKNQTDRFEAVTSKVLAFGLPERVCVFGLDDAVPSQFSFNEADHPRESAGSSKGGQFTSKHSGVLSKMAEYTKRTMGDSSFRSLTASQFAEQAKNWHAASYAQRDLAEFNSDESVAHLPPSKKRQAFGDAAKQYHIDNHQKDRFRQRSDVLATVVDPSDRKRRYRVADRTNSNGKTEYYGVYDHGDGTEEHEVTEGHRTASDAKQAIAAHFHQLQHSDEPEITDPQLQEHHAKVGESRKQEREAEAKKEAEIKEIRETATREFNEAKAGFDAIDVGKFKKQKIKLAGLAGEVDAQVSGFFGVDKRPGTSGYGITHIPTGMALGYVSRLDDAKRFATLAGLAGDWSPSDHKKFSPETMNAGKAIAKAMKTGDYRYIAHLIGGESKSLKVEQMGEDDMPSRRNKVEQFAMFPVDDMPGKKKKLPPSKKPQPGAEAGQKPGMPTDQTPPDDESDDDEDQDGIPDDDENPDDLEKDGDEDESLELDGNVAKKASDLVAELLKKLPGEKVIAALAGLLQSLASDVAGKGDADDKDDPNKLESAPITVQMGDDEMAGEADKETLAIKVQQFGDQIAELKKQNLLLKAGEHNRNKSAILADLTACEGSGQINKVDADALRNSLATVQFSEDDKHVSVTQSVADKVNWHKSLPKGTFWSDAEKIQQFGLEEHNVAKSGFFAPENDRELSAEEVEAACKAFQSNDYAALDTVAKK